MSHIRSFTICRSYVFSRLVIYDSSDRAGFRKSCSRGAWKHQDFTSGWLWRHHSTTFPLPPSLGSCEPAWRKTWLRDAIFWQWLINPQLRGKPEWTSHNMSRIILKPFRISHNLSRLTKQVTFNVLVLLRGFLRTLKGNMENEIKAGDLCGVHTDVSSKRVPTKQIFPYTYLQLRQCSH